MSNFLFFERNKMANQIFSHGNLSEWFKLFDVIVSFDALFRRRKISFNSAVENDSFVIYMVELYYFDD